jgi:uncharacterized lipoprotein YmbA
MLACLTWGLSGCSGNASSPQYYTLLPDQENFQPREPITASLGVWPVELTDMLDRNGIVSYQQQHRVNISTLNLWAGSLDENITDVMVSNLTNRLALKNVWMYPWDQADKPDFQLRLRMDSMAGPLSGPINILLHWSIKSHLQPQWQGWRRIQLQQPVTGDGYDAYVGAVNEGLDQASEILAAELDVVFRNRQRTEP